MLGVKSVQFSLHQGRKSSQVTAFFLLYSIWHALGETAYSFPYIRGGKVKLQHFLSRTLFGTHHVRGKQRRVSLHQGRKS